MNKDYSKKTIAIILSLGLVVRIALFFYLLDKPRAFIDDDSSTYLQSAENLRLGRGFSWEESPPYRLDAFRTPGYPVFLLFHRVVFGTYNAALITQSFLAVAIALIIFLLAREYGKIRIGYAAAAVFLAMPFSLNVSLKFLTQTFFSFVLMLAVFYWIRFLKTNAFKYFITAAILLPLAAYIRPIAQYLYIPFILSFIYAKWTAGSKIDFKDILKKSGLILAIFFLVLSPWLYRNYKTFGYVALSSITALQLYVYDAPAVYAFNHHVSYVEAHDILAKRAQDHFGMRQDQFAPLLSSGPYLQKKALEVMFESPVGLVAVRSGLLFKFFVRDGIRYWYNDFAPNAKTNMGSPLFYLLILERVFLFALFIGMLFAIPRSFYQEKQQKIMIFCFALVIFYFAALTGIMASAGLRYPVEALFILTGMIGIGEIKKLYVQYRRSSQS